MFLSKGASVWRLLQHRHAPSALTASSCRQACSSSRLVLGIETSCDDTGAAVVDESGVILGESLHSQKEVHLRTGGIIPTVAQQLHRDHIERVVQEALQRSGVTPSRLSAVATTVKPGLALSLAVGLRFSQTFVRRHNKPFIPIHHMEAHALTVRMLQPVAFPFLVLLVSGGHSLLAVARGVDDFLLLGQTMDEAPGDILDKVARRLSLARHPRCSALSGGQAVELLAKDGDRLKFPFTTPLRHARDCRFSFSGLRTQVTREIARREAEEGMRISNARSAVVTARCTYVFLGCRCTGGDAAHVRERHRGGRSAHRGHSLGGAHAPSRPVLQGERPPAARPSHSGSFWRSRKQPVHPQGAVDRRRPDGAAAALPAGQVLHRQRSDDRLERSGAPERRKRNPASRRGRLLPAKGSSGRGRHGGGESGRHQAALGQHGDPHLTHSTPN